MPPTLVVLSNLVEILESLRNIVPFPTLYLPEVQRWLKVSDDCCLETRMTHELSLSFHLFISSSPPITAFTLRPPRQRHLRLEE